MYRRAFKGFTLIELLVVIAIIGVLSAIVLAALNTARDNANAARIASDLQSIEKGLRAYAIEHGTVTWWGDSAGGSITGFVSANGLTGGYLSAPRYMSPYNTNYSYDNDGDTATCGVSGTAGVNLYLANVPIEVLNKLDDMVDNGDGFSCGRITASGSTLLYKLDYDPTI